MDRFHPRRRRRRLRSRSLNDPLGNKPAATHGTSEHRCGSGASKRPRRLPRDRFVLAATISIALLQFLFVIVPAISGKDDANSMRGFVNAFVPKCTTTISRARNTQDSNSLLWLARETADEDRKKKKKDSQWEDSSKDSFFGSFFKGKDSDDSEYSKIQEEDDESSKVPILGRFFKTEEEKAEKEERKAEKEERKKRKKQEKERIKLEQREKKRQQKQQQQSGGSGSGTNKKRSKIIPAVKNYLEERQIRKDAEILRAQVQQREQDRQKQMEKDAEELRLEVQKREQERLRQREEQAKKAKPAKPAAAQAVRSSSSSDDSVQRQVATQKELDQKRKERAEKAESTRSKSRSKANKDKESNNSKSQRFGSVVSAAQKFVSGVFDNNDQKKNEEWIVVAPKTRISPGEIVAVTAGGIDLLLVASKDGSAVHCVANSCPHLGTPLEVGSLERLPIETSLASSWSSSANATDVKPVSTPSFFQEKDISRMLTEDGCEDCIVCPLHKTAFALESGEVRGEWCPYPPVIGKLTGAIKQQSNLPVFDVRTKGKNIEVRLNTPVEIGENEEQ